MKDVFDWKGEMILVRGKISPNDGGCWFCYTKTDNMDFDMEFDTYLHRECLIKALKEDDNPEAIIIGKYTYSDDPEVYELVKITEEKSIFFQDWDGEINDSDEHCPYCDGKGYIEELNDFGIWNHQAGMPFVEIINDICTCQEKK